MKSLEIIKIRTSHQNQLKLMSSLHEIIITAQQKIDRGNIKLFSNQDVSSDYMICIFWDQPQSESPGSEIGLEIRKALEASGLVNHSNWIEHKIRKQSE